LDERELARTLEWQTGDGKRYRWDVEGILTQVFGNAWYHRGARSLNSSPFSAARRLIRIISFGVN
jgi:hypothetical protein